MTIDPTKTHNSDYLGKKTIQGQELEGISSTIYLIQIRSQSKVSSWYDLPKPDVHHWPYCSGQQVSTKI